MTPGIKDVAARAGVSVGTVSNVLNRPDTVGRATRDRVEHAIADLGYVRNESARHLRAGRSRTMAYVVIDAGNPFFTDVARGVEEAARAEGLALFLCNSDQDAEREDDYLDTLLEQRVLGVLVTPVSVDTPRLADFARRGMPVVLVDRADQGGFEGCSVSVDDLEGGDLACTHLLELGHTHIGFVGGPAPMVQVRDRFAGAQRALDRAGPADGALTRIPTEALTVAEGRRAGARFLGLPESRRPSAVVCANDLLALGFLQQMTTHGLLVPDDVAIVGYDDIEFAGAAAVPLTSVRQPRHELGRMAAKLLLQEVDGGDGAGGAHVHRQVEFIPELVVRDSTRPRRPVRRRA